FQGVSHCQMTQRLAIASAGGRPSGARPPATCRGKGHPDLEKRITQNMGAEPAAHAPKFVIIKRAANANSIFRLTRTPLQGPRPGLIVGPALSCTRRIEDPLPMTGAGTDRTKPSRTGGPAVILVRPQLAVNIGMCARAMANFGLTDLRLVAPREGWPRQRAIGNSAHAAAAGGAGLLETAGRFGNLEDAVLDLNFVWATTARERGQFKPIRTPAEAMPECAVKLPRPEKHGILFGPERTGLSNDEVALANAIITFPVNPAYASLNLAQAV